MADIKSVLYDGREFDLHFGDCIKHMPMMPAACVDHAVFSPPFPSLYSYTNEEGDIGNSEDLAGEMKLHLSFFYKSLLKIMKPGRVAIVHVADIVKMKRVGGVGLFDFRGFNVRLAQRAGWVYEYTWAVRKNPQAQAIRTKSRELQFNGLESDRAKSRGALPDYLIKLRAPGENAVPVRDWEPIGDGDIDWDGVTERKMIHPVQVARNDWIQWAEHCWTGIRETDTLNVKEGRSEDDVKHICALQQGVIDRSIRLFSNPGELIFTPFAGIGSEPYRALLLGRRAYGCELNRKYFDTAIINCDRAIAKRKSQSAGLFDEPVDVEPEAMELIGED